MNGFPELPHINLMCSLAYRLTWLANNLLSKAAFRLIVLFD